MGGLCTNIGGDGSGGSGNGSPYPMHHAGMMLPPPSGTGWTMPTDYAGIGASFGGHSLHEGISSSSPPLHQHIGQVPTLMGTGSGCGSGTTSKMPISTNSTNSQLNPSWNMHDTKDNIVVQNFAKVGNSDKGNEEEDKKPDISSND